MVGECLLDAITQYKLKHTLVFLSDQTKAQRFEKILIKHKPKYTMNFNTYVNTSNDTRTVIEVNEKNFVKEGNPKILLSVGIYNEGVDIECIDSILFAEERTSPTTIVQNIGRCVRLYKDNEGNDKKLSYIMLPNILYDCGDAWDDNETIFSSKFKQIRKMIQILGQQNEKGFMFNKYVKTKNDKDKDNENEDINEDIDYIGDASDTNDEMEPVEIKANSDHIDLVNKVINGNKEIDISDVESFNLNKMYGLEIRDKNIANTTIETLKKMLWKHNIKTIKEYGNYCKQIKSPIINPQKDFTREWISWSDLFSGNTFTYKEAKEFIKRNINLSKVITPKDWFDLYDSIVIKELNGLDVSPGYINGFMKLPSQPKDYYKDTFISLDDLLGKQLIHDIVIKVPTVVAPYNKNANTNLTIIANDDDKRIMKPLIWNELEHNIKFTELQKYLNKLLNIDSVITTKIKFKSSGNFESITLLFAHKDKPAKIIGSIDPLQNFYKYDKDINNPDIFYLKDKPHFTATILIKDGKVIDELVKIKTYAKNINMHNMNNMYLEEIEKNKQIEESDKELVEVPVKKIVDKINNQGKSWLPAEEAQLIKELQHRIKFDKIAELHGRTTGAVCVKVKKIVSDLHSSGRPINEISKLMYLSEKYVSSIILQNNPNAVVIVHDKPINDYPFINSISCV